MMRRDDVEGDYLLVQQNKTQQRIRIFMVNDDRRENSLGALIRVISERNAQHSSSYLIVSKHGKRMTAAMLRKRWDEAREQAKKTAIEGEDALLAGRIAAFQFRDIRPKAASKIKNIEDASLLLGHTKSDIKKRVYRRLGTTAKPSK